MKEREVEKWRDAIRLKIARGEKTTKRERRVLGYAPAGRCTCGMRR